MKTDGTIQADKSAFLVTAAYHWCCADRTMRVYQLHSEYTVEGDEYARWIEDDGDLMDLPQSKAGSVLAEWPKNLRYQASTHGRSCEVLFSPDAFVVSSRLRDAIAHCAPNCIEWLPIDIVDVGVMYVLHPTASVSLAEAAVVRQHQPGDNIVEIGTYAFDDPESLPTCFLIRQPPTSPAGKAGSACTGIYMTSRLASHVRRYRGLDVACVLDTGSALHSIEEVQC